MGRRRAKPGECKPCPFCGSTYLVIETFEYTDVACFHCGVAGSLRDEESEAIEAWNTRDNRNAEKDKHE